MSKKMTHEEFLEKLESGFPEYKKHYKIVGKYSLLKTNILVATKYGMCSISPYKLMKGQIPFAIAAVNKEEFAINRFKEAHNNFYDYSKVVYKRGDKLVKVVCPIHGEFEISPSNHIAGRGCKLCYLKTGNNVKFSQEEFLSKLPKDREYSVIGEYTGRANNILVSTKYGDCNVNAGGILTGRIPSIQTAVNKNVYIINKFREVHGDVYDYSGVVYVRDDVKVSITCKLHGEFRQIVNSHLMGSGCSICNKGDNCWTHSNWEKAGNKSKNFSEFKFYIIKVGDKREKFFKVGKTFRDIKERFPSKSILPYDFKILKVIEGPARYISKLEIIIKKEFAHYKYLPKLKFGGRYECFSCIDLNKINKIINNL